MNVVFVEPFFPSNQRHFARALAEAGATVIGIGEYPADALDGELKGWLHHYEQVRSVTDVGASTAAEVAAFAEQVGYPVILKPRSGAGALDTMRADDDAGLQHALGVFGGQGVESIAVEEFIEGHEGFYDTITINGEVAVDFVSH